MSTFWMHFVKKNAITCFPHMAQREKFITSNVHDFNIAWQLQTVVTLIVSFVTRTMIINGPVVSSSLDKSRAQIVSIDLNYFRWYYPTRKICGGVWGFTLVVPMIFRALHQLLMPCIMVYNSKNKYMLVNMIRELHMIGNSMTSYMFWWRCWCWHVYVNVYF